MRSAAATTEPKKKHSPYRLPALAAWTVAIVLVLPVSSWGQVRSGNFWVDAWVTITEEYTTNVYLFDALEEEDLITGIYPGVAMGYLTRTTQFDLSYGTNFLFHNEDARLDLIGDDHYVTGHFLHEVSPRFTVWALDSLAITSDPLTFLFAEGEATQLAQLNVFTSRNDVITNTGSLGFRLEATEHSDILVQAYSDIIRFGDNRVPVVDDDGEELGVFNYQDADTYTAAVEYAYNFHRDLFGVIRTTGSYYQFHEIDEEDGSLFIEDGDAWSGGAMLLGRYRPTEEMFLEAGGGAAYIDEEVGTEAGGIESTQEWTFLAHMGVNWLFTRSRLSLTGGHDVSPRGGLGGTARRWSARAEYRHNITESLTGLAGGTYARFRTFADQEDDQDDRSGDIETYTANGRLMYQVTSWLRVSVEYTYVRQNAFGPEAENLDSHRALLALRLSLPEVRGGGRGVAGIPGRGGP